MFAKIDQFHGLHVRRNSILSDFNLWGYLKPLIITGYTPYTVLFAADTKNPKD